MRAPLPSAGSDETHPCAGCKGRRTFLRDAVGTALAFAGLSALGPLRELAALEPRSARGTVRYPIPSADGVSVDKQHEVIVARATGAVYAFALGCPHQNTALRALPGTAGFACPKHKSRYRADGTFISGRATRSMDRLQVARDGDAIVVDPDVVFESDRDPAKWAAAVVRL